MGWNFLFGRIRKDYSDDDDNGGVLGLKYEHKVFIAPETTTGPKSIDDSEISSSHYSISDQLPLVPNNNSTTNAINTTTIPATSNAAAEYNHSSRRNSLTATIATQVTGASGSSVSELPYNGSLSHSNLQLNNNFNGNITNNHGHNHNNNFGINGSNSHNNNSGGISSSSGNMIGNGSNNGSNSNSNMNNNNNSRNLINGTNRISGGSSSGGFYNYNNVPSSYSSLMESTSSSSLIGINSRRPPEGKDSEEFTLVRDKMLIGHNSLGSLHKISNEPTPTTAEIFSASKENGKINVQVTVLVDTHNLDNALSGTTLANLKKQRSLSRTNAITENGSVIASTSHHSITSAASATANSTSGQSIELSLIPSTSSPTGTMKSNSISAGIQSQSLQQQNQQQQHQQQMQLIQQPSITKFSGVTSDVVSDSTRSKKCCLLM